MSEIIPRGVTDMTGMQFGDGRLTVIGLAKRRNTKCQAFWICKCTCGRILTVRGDNLRRGNTTQCSVCKTENGGRGGKSSDFRKGG